MKQRRTQQNRKKIPTSRARTTPDTVDGVRRSGENQSANRGANPAKSRANGDHAVPVSQAARMLGVDASTIKRMCASGRLHSFKTTGGHWRIALADIEAVQRGDGNGDNLRRPTSSPLVQHRRESLEEMRLLIEQKKARGALEELEDQERQRREQKEAARRAEENEARREQREREVEQARRDREREEREQQREEFERRQNWVDEQVEFALKSVPPDVAARFASEIQLSVEDALQGLAASRPKSLVERVVCGAVDRVLQPWAREQQRKQDIARAANEAANPLYVPGLWDNRECEIRARE